MNTQQITRTAMFTALACVTAIIVRFMPQAMVPFSLLPMIALIAGGVLGSKYGSLSMLAYVIIGLIGLPVFASEPFGGLAYVLKPTFGFLIGFIVAPMIMGIFLRNKEKTLSRLLITMLLGLIIIYLVGIPYLYYMVHFVSGKSSFGLWQAIQIGFIPYISFDLIKAIVGAFIAKSVLDRIDDYIS